jgi:heptaprenyl diphosphate synthase
MNRKTKQMASFALLVAVSMVLSFVETLVPSPAPGIKLGLANIGVMFVLLAMGPIEAVALSLLRVFLVSLTFGNAFSLLYSLSGAVLSLAGMLLLRKTGKFSPVGISVAGGVLHNVGQIAAAVVIAETPGLVFYLPLLLVSGVAAGVVVGAAAAALAKRVKWTK